MAVLTDMGVTAQGIFQPKLKNRFRVTFIGLNGDAQGLTKQCLNFERPKLVYDEVKLDRYNSVSYVAAKHSFEPATFVFEDDVGGQVSNILQRQSERQQKIIGVNPAPLLPAERAGELYKFAIRAEMLDGNDYAFETWAYEGCFFQRLEYDSMDYTVSESVKVTVTVRFDHARQLITGIKYNAHPNAGVPL